MNSTTVKKFLDRLPVRHTGVYASDRLPTRVRPGTALVANTVPHTEGGEHWVAFYWDRDANHIEYFDSFGRQPLQTDYQQFLRRNSRHCVFNKYRLQGFDTSVCGHYCLTYLYCRAVHGITMNDYVHRFDLSQGRTAENDAMVRLLFRDQYLKKKGGKTRKKKKKTLP